MRHPSTWATRGIDVVLVHHMKMIEILLEFKITVSSEEESEDQTMALALRTIKSRMKIESSKFRTEMFQVPSSELLWHPVCSIFLLFFPSTLPRWQSNKSILIIYDSRGARNALWWMGFQIFADFFICLLCSHRCRLVFGAWAYLGHLPLPARRLTRSEFNISRKRWQPESHKIDMEEVLITLNKARGREKSSSNWICRWHL